MVKTTGLAAALVMLATTGSAATVLNFNEFAHGDVVSSVSVLGVTGTVTADGNSAQSPDVAVAFNTRLTGTADPDLEGPFVNAAGVSRNFGRALIIQENPDMIPDDDGQGGVITFSFDSALTFLGFNILDDATITVTSDLGDTVSASVAEDNMWGRVRTNWVGITSLTFDFGRHSGAIDSLRFEAAPAPVPVPAGLPMLAAGLAVLGWRSRRQG